MLTSFSLCLLSLSSLATTFIDVGVRLVTCLSMPKSIKRDFKSRLVSFLVTVLGFGVLRHDKITIGGVGTARVAAVLE